MAMAVSKVQIIGREVAQQSRLPARPATDSAQDKPHKGQKFGALVARYAPHRDDRATALDYTSAPFVAQLIASRDAESQTRLQHRMMADRTAAAYQAAEALPDRLPIGLYMERTL